MASWRRALSFAFLAWLMPFAVSFALGPVKQSWRSLFESVMPVVVTTTVIVLALLYFRNEGTRSAREGIKLGMLWLVISVLIDLPLMLSPPLSYSPVEYAADVGLTYLIMPIITIGIAVASSFRTPVTDKEAA